MNNLTQVFGKTLAPAALKGKHKSDETSEESKDPMLEAYAPTDSVDLRGSGMGSFKQAAFLQMNQGTAGLPSLSRGYSSHGGGLLDVVG
jgi:hypothetical protein